MNTHRKASVVALFLWVTLIAVIPFFFAHVHHGSDHARVHAVMSVGHARS